MCQSWAAGHGDTSPHPCRATAPPTHPPWLAAALGAAGKAPGYTHSFLCSLVQANKPSKLGILQEQLGLCSGTLWHGERGRGEQGCWKVAGDTALSSTSLSWLRGDAPASPILLGTGLAASTDMNASSPRDKHPALPRPFFALPPQDCWHEGQGARAQFEPETPGWAPAEAQLSHSAVSISPAGPWQGQSDMEPPATTAPGTAQQ